MVSGRAKYPQKNGVGGDRKSGIFIIYMGSRRAKYNDIAASTSVIFRPRQKNSLGQDRALGHFLTSDEK